jgi:hypothetical protein
MGGRSLARYGMLGMMPAALACAGSPPPAPLRPEPIAWVDTLPIEEPPAREANELGSLFEASVADEIFRPARFRYAESNKKEATNITRFDDVVASAWFQHRNGRQRLSPDEIRRGATTTAGPDTSRTLTIIAGKTEGISPGFTVRDASGDRYIIKFDPKGNLRLASSADVVSSRLFYAAGYNVPEDFIIVFDSTRLQVGEGAEVSIDGRPVPLTLERVHQMLAETDPLPDGRYLALASKYVPGTPKGPFRLEGRWSEDPNDYYYHEYRRELRGLLAVAAWLNHVDMRFANTMDVWIEDPGYIRHYLIDFAATLGSGTIRPHTPREGVEYNFDFWVVMARLFTLGFYTQGWENETAVVTYPEIGWMRASQFEPQAWKPNWPNKAFTLATLRDMYWGAKLVGSFTDEQIQAAVSAAGLPAAAADELARMIEVRRDKTVGYWYRQVTPIENVEVSSTARALTVTFDDYAIAAGVWDAANVTYLWRFAHPALGIELSGRMPAASGIRQELRIDSMGGPESNGLDAEAAIATLEIRAVDGAAPPRSRENRAATLYLTAGGGVYLLSGLDH